MLWIEVIRQLSAQLAEPFELEFVVRGLGQSGRFKGIQTNKDRLTMDKLTWLNLMREPIGDEDIESLTEIVQQLKKNRFRHNTSSVGLNFVICNLKLTNGYSFHGKRQRNWFDLSWKTRIL